VTLSSDGRRVVVLATAGHVEHARTIVLDHLDRKDLAALAAITAKLNKGPDPSSS
jgi:hypothetical protein